MHHPSLEPSDVSVGGLSILTLAASPNLTNFDKTDFVSFKFTGRKDEEEQVSEIGRIRTLEHHSQGTKDVSHKKVT